MIGESTPGQRSVRFGDVSMLAVEFRDPPAILSHEHISRDAAHNIEQFELPVLATRFG